MPWLLRVLGPCFAKYVDFLMVLEAPMHSNYKTLCDSPAFHLYDKNLSQVPLFL